MHFLSQFPTSNGREKIDFEKKNDWMIFINNNLANVALISQRNYFTITK